MIIFYSGSTVGESLPERALKDKKPGIMLTFFEMTKIGAKKKDTLDRLFRLKERRTKKEKKCK